MSSPKEALESQGPKLDSGFSHSNTEVPKSEAEPGVDRGRESQERVRDRMMKREREHGSERVGKNQGVRGKKSG